MYLFLMVPLVGFQCLIAVFPDHTRLLFGHYSEKQLKDIELF